MNYRDIYLSKLNEGYWETAGLLKKNYKEFKLKSFSNDQGEIDLLKFIIDYVLNEQPIIQNNETIAYGLWLLQFRSLGNFFILYELDTTFENWAEGADNAIYYFHQQLRICQGEGVSPNFPKLTQNLAVSRGVIEGELVYGIRYNEPEHMSGWYLTTDNYKGNIKELQVVNIQIIIKHRKDLLQFLALPPGFVFELTERKTCHIYKTPLDPVRN